MEESRAMIERNKSEEDRGERIVNATGRKYYGHRRQIIKVSNKMQYSGQQKRKNKGRKVIDDCSNVNDLNVEGM